MKDAKGHGSNGRGSADDRLAQRERSMFAAGKPGLLVRPDYAAHQQGVEQATYVSRNASKFGPFASAVAGFREKYGAPRDHAAEQRAFSSGKREINRMQRGTGFQAKQRILAALPR